MPKTKQKKLNKEEIEQIAIKNQKYLEELRQNRPPLSEELTDIINFPKDLTPDGFKKLIKHLKDEYKIEIDDTNTQLQKIINLVFAFGIDEGVKEALHRMELRADIWPLVITPPQQKQ